MTLDDNFTDFMEKVDFYLKQQYDSHVEDITILEDGETHSCMVSLQPWAVGSILMSCPT